MADVAFGAGYGFGVLKVPDHSRPEENSWGQDEIEAMAKNPAKPNRIEMRHPDITDYSRITESFAKGEAKETVWDEKIREGKAR